MNRRSPVHAALCAAAVVMAATVMVGSGGDGGGPSPVEASTSERHLGAEALERPGLAATQWEDLESIDDVRPAPDEVGRDRPTPYSGYRECEVRPDETEVRTCPWGTVDSGWNVVLVGDSKALQWQPVLATIAEQEGWRLTQMTKSGCAFTDAMRVRNDEPWTACRTWGREAIEEIIEMRPDLVLTSHRAPSAVPDDWPDSAGPSESLMVDGLVRYWDRITEAGIPVATILDNPSPPIRSVPQCLLDRPEDLTSCSFDLEQGNALSGAPAQREAARRVPGAAVLDLTSALCPDGRLCPPVIGDVLVYRDGSHLTRSYVESARSQVAAALRDATDGQFGRG